MKQRNYLGLKPVKDEGYTYIIGMVDRKLSIRAIRMAPTAFKKISKLKVKTQII